MWVELDGETTIEIDFSEYSEEDRKKISKSVERGERLEFENVFCELDGYIDLSDYAMERN